MIRSFYQMEQLKKFDDLPQLSEEDERKLDIGKLPFGGLLGNTVLLRVLREIVADPYREFRPKKLQILASSSPPRIKHALDALTTQGFLRNISMDSQRPVYMVNLESKQLIALTLLAYSVIDDRDKTNCMDEAIKDYCTDVFGEKMVFRASTENQYTTYVNVSHTTYNIVMSQNTKGDAGSIDLAKASVDSSIQLWEAITEGV